MRYAYHDLGTQPEGSTVIVRWRGSAADVLLLDPVSFSKFCQDRRLVFRGDGGHYGRSPARLSIPRAGRWYVVAELGGNTAEVKPTVEVLNPDDGEPETSHEAALVDG
jgi:Domain of unknown function (DUF1883)